jgi:predicted branched-subunit amino acid permease
MPFSRSAFLAGVRDVAPMILGVAPFGTITGVAAVGVGLTPAEAMGMSLLVFAGASQLAGIALIGQGAAAAVILLTTFMINLRMAMYSASLSVYLRGLGTGTRVGLAYLMTDQAYAFSVLRYRREPEAPRRDYYLGVAVPLWIVWQLDFAIPLTFLALLAPAVRDRPGLAAAIVGGGLALALRGLPYNLGLVIASLAGIAGGTALEGRRAARADGAEAGR